MIHLFAAAALAAGATCGPATPSWEGSWVGDACLASTDVAAFCDFAFPSGCPAWDRQAFNALPWHGGPCEGGGHIAEGTYFPEEPTTLWFDADGRLVGAEIQCVPSECAPGCCDGYLAYDTRWGEPFDCVATSGDTGARDVEPSPSGAPADEGTGVAEAEDAGSGCGCDHGDPAGSTGWVALALGLFGRRAVLPGRDGGNRRAWGLRDAGGCGRGRLS